MKELNVAYINMDNIEKQNDKQNFKFKKKIQVPVACLTGWHLMKGNDKFINLNLMNV